MARTLLALLLACVSLGCASPQPSRYLNREFYTLAVLPIDCRVAEAGHAPQVMQPQVERAARARGYRVLKPGALAKGLSEHGLRPSDVASTDPGQLARWLGVDGVVTTVIHTWGATATPLGSKVTVMAEFSIHDRQGQLFWRKRWQASRSRKFLAALKNLQPKTANELCVQVCEEAFRRIKLAGFDPDPEQRGN